MFQSKLLALAIASMLAIPAANASVDLIAVNGLSGSRSDLSPDTAATLENGVPGNLLGGIGSGLAYGGADRFVAIPDRGPNAVPFNSAVSDTASYINRFQTILMKLSPSPEGSALPFTLTPNLVSTTLLYSSTPLAYGDGGSVGLASGAPAQNRRNKFYFTGRADNFDGSRLSNNPSDARLDPESIRVSNDGQSVYVSDEYGPYVYRFNRLTGERTAIYTLPNSFAVMHLSANGDAEIANNTSGRVTNKGMEGLAISPNGTVLFGAMQSPLLQDGGTNAAYTRIVRIDLQAGTMQQYAYPLTNIGTVSKPKYPTISDVVAINDHELLVDERDGKGLGDGSTAAFKRLYRINLSGAHTVDNLSGASALAPWAVSKTLFLDIVQVLNAHGISSNDIPAKLEGVAFGPDVTIEGATRHTLFVANDNDFVGTVTDSLHPNGVANPNMFFVFAFSAADLPSYVPQQISADVPW
jgi:hypothetical protein